MINKESWGSCQLSMVKYQLAPVFHHKPLHIVPDFSFCIFHSSIFIQFFDYRRFSPAHSTT